MKPDYVEELILPVKVQNWLCCFNMAFLSLCFLVKTVMLVLKSTFVASHKTPILI